jgi:hypothetical protein
MTSQAVWQEWQSSVKADLDARITSLLDGLADLQCNALREIFDGARPMTDKEIRETLCDFIIEAQCISEAFECL